MKDQLSVLGIAGAMLLGSTAVSPMAQAQGACSPFTLVSSGVARSVDFVDVDPPGVSRGDMRIGVRGLTSEAGTPAGEARWVLTVLQPQAEDSGVSFIEWIFALSDGLIFANGLKAIVSAPDDTATQTHDQSAQFAIVGGTGVYSGARGTHLKTVDGLKEIYRLDITCD